MNNVIARFVAGAVVLSPLLAQAAETPVEAAKSVKKQPPRKEAKRAPGQGQLPTGVSPKPASHGVAAVSGSKTGAGSNIVPKDLPAAPTTTLDNLRNPGGPHEQPSPSAAGKAASEAHSAATNAPY